jgi:hypothetical protein
MPKLIPPPLDPGGLAEWAREAVIAATDVDGDGRDRHKAAVRMLARKIDQALRWPVSPLGLIAEAVDGPAARILLGAVVKHAYQALESDGAV